MQVCEAVHLLCVSRGCRAVLPSVPTPGCSQTLLVLHQQLPVPFTPPVLASASSMPRPLQVPPMLRGANVAKPAASLKETFWADEGLQR